MIRRAAPTVRPARAGVPPPSSTYPTVRLRGGLGRAVAQRTQAAPRVDEQV